MGKDVERFEGSEKAKIHSEQQPKKYQIRKRQAMMAYIDTGLQNSRPSMTHWLPKWIDACKEQT